jgi:cytochrome c oxidase cbb3-type subunit 3
MRLGAGGKWKSTAAATALAVCVLALTGCERLLNGPESAHEVEKRPDKILSFNTLYGENCAACHGVDGRNGPALNMDNPIYYGLVTDAQIKNYVTNGGPGGQMPAFGTSAGGLLTDDQINAIVTGMRQRWARPAMLTNMTLPAYAATQPGDVSHGAQVYAQACASCHGAAGPNGIVMHPGKAGSITDPTYLSLISDQGMRTIVIAGRPDLGQPDYRNDIPGHPLSDQDITDVVAWLSSHRMAQPGNPHPTGSGTELQRRTSGQ